MVLEGNCSDSDIVQKTLFLMFLRSINTALACKWGKNMACVTHDLPTLHVGPMQLQADFVVHTLWWVRFLFDCY